MAVLEPQWDFYFMDCLKEYVFDIINAMIEADKKPKRPSHLSIFRDTECYIWFYPESGQYIYDGRPVDYGIIKLYLENNFIEYTGMHRYDGARMCRYSIKKNKVTKPIRYIPKAVREAVMARYQNKCVTCGTTERVEIDHIFPVSRGGKSDIKNLQLLCRSCNAKKSASLPKITGIEPF
jgi:hypothetical protein